MSTESRELKLYIDNDGTLYRRQTLPIIKNLMRKKAAGKYDAKKAEVAFKHLADAGAKKYAKEHGSSASSWSRIFSPADRKAAARAMAADFNAEARLGNYNEFVPKKYIGPTRSDGSCKFGKTKTGSRAGLCKRRPSARRKIVRG